MKPFKFKLQTALDIKIREEDLQKEKLAEATRIYRERLSSLDILRARLVQIYEILRGKQTRRVEVVEVRQWYDYIPYLNERIKQQEEVTEAARQVMEHERKKLVEIMKDIKVFEKLKAKHFQEYMAACLREEQKQIDEMATVRYVHSDPAV